MAKKQPKRVSIVCTENFSKMEKGETYVVSPSIAQTMISRGVAKYEGAKEEKPVQTDQVTEAKPSKKSKKK